MDVSSHLKLPEVAMRLGVSEKTARRYIKSGTLPSIFVGNAYRVHPDDLAAFVDRARVTEPQAPKDQAPPSSEPSFNDVLNEEERRKELRNIRKVLADAHKLLESWFKEYLTGRDGRKLTDLTAVSLLTYLGVAQFVQEEVGPMNDRESERIYLVGTRYEELIDDLLEVLDSMPEVDAEEEGFGVLIEIRERLRNREAS